MSFGLYPEISLKEAREKRELARENLRKNINPIDSKNSNFKIETTFKFVALKWLELMKKSWSESNYKKIKSNLENNAFPNIGNKDIKDITRKEILIIIEKMENRNAIEYANRLLNNWSGNIISDIEIK
jgi:integrase